MLTWTAVGPAEKGMTCAKKFWLMVLGIGTPRGSVADGVGEFASLEQEVAMPVVGC